MECRWELGHSSAAVRGIPVVVLRRIVEERRKIVEERRNWTLASCVP